VDHDEVVVFVEHVGVLLVVARPDLAHLRRPLQQHPLQAVMHRLRDVKELVGAADHLPVGFEAEVRHQRHERGQNLGDAAAERRGVDVQHPRPAQPPGQFQNLSYARVADDRPVRLDASGSCRH